MIVVKANALEIGPGILRSSGVEVFKETSVGGQVRLQVSVVKIAPLEAAANDGIVARLLPDLLEFGRVNLLRYARVLDAAGQSDGVYLAAGRAAEGKRDHDWFVRVLD